MIDQFRRLIELSAGHFEHIDGQCIACMDGTRCLLKAWGARDALQQAGLFHLVYNDALLHRRDLFDQQQRNLVADVIGEDCEAIAYYYAALQPAKFVAERQQGDSEQYFDHFSQQLVSIAPQLLKDILELCVAVELEQALRHPPLDSRQHALFSQIHNHYCAYLSRAANNRLARLLV